MERVIVVMWEGREGLVSSGVMGLGLDMIGFVGKLVTRWLRGFRNHPILWCTGISSVTTIHQRRYLSLSPCHSARSPSLYFPRREEVPAL